MLLGRRVGAATPLIDDRLRHAHGNQAGRNALVGAEDDGFLTQRARVGGKTLGQIQSPLLPPHDLTQCRLMIAATEEIGLGRHNRGKRCQFEVPQIKQKQRGRPR